MHGPHRRRGEQAPRAHRQRAAGRGRPAPRAAAGDQAAGRHRLLPRHPPPPRAAGRRPAHQDERTHPQGPEEDRRTREEGQVDGASEEAGGPWPHPSPRPQEHRGRPGAHQDVLQQHDRRAHRQGRERDRVGVRRLGGLQGLAQVDAVRRSGDRRLVRAQGHGARPPEGRGLRQGPGLRPRDAIRSLQAAGLEILGVRDVTPQAHNGVRAKKRRRV